MAELTPTEQPIQAEQTRGWIEVPGGKVWYRGYGTDKPGIPVLIAHGGPGYSGYDFENLKALADERPVYVWDQLDSGESERPNDPANWTVERYVQEFADVRKGLGLEKVHLIGHSWGGIMLSEYLLTHKPEGVVSATFASPMLSMRLLQEDIADLIPRIQEDALEILLRYDSLLSSPTTNWKSEENKKLKDDFKRIHETIENRYILGDTFFNFMTPAMQRSFDLYNPALEQYFIGNSPVTPKGVLKDYDRLNDLHQIQVPTLFTGGRNDLMSPRTLELLRQEIPDAEIEIFENSAHMPHTTEEALYLARMRRFFQNSEQRMAA